MIQKRPQTLEKVGRNLSLGAFVGVLVFLPFEKGVDASYDIAQLLVLVGFILRLIPQAKRRFWAVAGGIFVVSIVLLIGLVAAYVTMARGMYDAGKIAEEPLYTIGEIAGALIRNTGALYFCMILLFLTQFVYRPQVWTPHDRWTKVVLACMWVFLLIVIMSALFSTDPLQSFRDLRKYMAPYVLIYMIVVETLYSWRHYKIVITTACLVGIVISIASLGIRYAYVKGGPDLRRIILDDNKWVLDQVYTDPDTNAKYHEIRNMWPFKHQNRLCAYAVMICFFVWLQFFVTRNWELRTLVVISALLPFATMLATLTRGGWLGLAAGMAALVLMVNWRAIWVFLAVVVATWWISPQPIRNKVLSIFNLSTYTGEMGTASDRILIWRHGFEAFGERPILGQGYGWERFEQWWDKKGFPPLESGEKVTHAHNNFLEVAVETGVIGLTAFLAFCAALFVQVFRALLQTDRLTKRRFVVAGFFGLLVAMMMYGMSNYSLRYRVGMLTWVCFGLITLLPAILRFIPEDESQAEDKPAKTPTEPPPASGSEPPPTPAQG